MCFVLRCLNGRSLKIQLLISFSWARIDGASPKLKPLHLEEDENAGFFHCPVHFKHFISNISSAIGKLFESCLTGSGGWVQK